jgi:hypothetical protein
MPGLIDTIRIPSETLDAIDVLYAQADTLLQQDSSRVKVIYYYPPLNYFDVQMDLRDRIIYRTRETTITNQVAAPFSLWDRFGYSINAGFGYGLINNNFDIYIGAGVSYKLN